MSLVVRQKNSRRLGLPVNFPLTDSQQAFVIKDRRKLADRRFANIAQDDLKIIPTLYKLALDLIDGARVHVRK